MSIPIRATDGCTVATRNNPFTKPPFWLIKSKPYKHTFSHCPTKIHYRTTEETFLFTPFGKCVGNWIRWENGGWHLELINHKDLKWFFGKDVYCLECKMWHFKGMKDLYDLKVG